VLGHKARYGITTDSIEASKNTVIDKHTHLTRTRINKHDYTSLVEWSGGDTLIIQVFEDEGKSIVIRSDLIAKPFIQLWYMTDRSLRNSVDYKRHPEKFNKCYTCLDEVRTLLVSIQTVV
jgi:hypothetical protein